MKLRTSLLCLILLTAALLRLWQIDTLPPGFHFDESFEGLEAWRILTDPSYRPIFLEGNFGVLPVNAYANAFTFWLTQLVGGEVGPAAMRTTSAVVGVLSVLALYFLAAEMRRHDDALPAAFPFLAAAALAVMRWHIHFSRMAIEPIYVPQVWTVAAWLLMRGWRTGSLPAFAGGGVALALSIYTYQAAWIVPFLALPVLAVLILRQPDRLRTRWPGIVLSGGVAVVLAAPLLLFFWQRPELMLVRPQQVTVVDGGPGQVDFWANTWATLRMYSLWGMTGDLDPRRNVPGLPVMSPWLAVAFYAGVAWSLWRVRRPAFAVPLIGLVGLALPGFVTEYAPHFHRILGMAAPTALLVGLGLSGPIALAAGRKWGRPLSTAALGAGIVVLLAGGVTSATTYFGRWATLPDLYHAFDEGLWRIGQWMAEQPEDAVLYLTPRDATHPTLGFAYAVAGRAMPPTFDGRSVFPATDGPAPAAEQYVVIEHEDFRTRLLLPELFPTAAVSQTWLDWNGAVYAQVYTRPAGSEPQRQPHNPLPAELGDGIRLLGYDVLPEAPQTGGVLYVQFHWAADSAPAGAWTVFVHLLDGSGALVAGKDGPPGGGTLPTDRWQAGWRILDEYQIALPADLPDGTYHLRAGLYDGGGQRLPGDGPVDLGSVKIGE